MWVVPDAFIEGVGNSHKKSDAVNPHRFPIYINVFAYFNSSARMASIWLRDSLAMLTETTMSFNGAMI